MQLYGLHIFSTNSGFPKATRRHKKVGNYESNEVRFLCSSLVKKYERELFFYFPT